MPTKSATIEFPENTPFDLLALACKMLGWTVMHGDDADDTEDVEWLIIGKKDKLEALQSKLENGK